MGIPQPAESGSPDALTAIYREQARFVWRSLRRLGVQDDALEDACQDVFIVAARRLDDFEARSSIRTWLFGISMRVARTDRRTRARAQRKLDALQTEGPLRSPQPSAPYERSDAQRILAQLLQTLGEDKRAVYVLVELEGMSAVEVAQAFDVNVNTIYTRLRAARRELQQAAAAHHPEETP